MTASKRVYCFRLCPEVVRRLDAVAECMELTRSDIVREAIVEWLEGFYGTVRYETNT